VPDIVGNTEPARTAKAELEAFLHRRVYRHPRVLGMAEAGQHWIKALFDAYRAAPREMSERFVRRSGGQPAERVVGDYLAGMTDRFARQEYERLFPRERSV